MSGKEEAAQVLAAKFAVIFPHLDERQRRLLMGAEARALGHGGIRLVARAAGVREATVSLGVDELDSGEEPLGRARRPGGGRKRAAGLDPGLRPALLALAGPDERGDPASPLRWTARSTRALADELGPGRYPEGATVSDEQMAVLAGLFGVVAGTIAKAERQIRPLLTQAGYVIEPAGPRLGTLTELTAYASSHGIDLTAKAKSAR